MQNLALTSLPAKIDMQQATEFCGYKINAVMQHPTI